MYVSGAGSNAGIFALQARQGAEGITGQTAGTQEAGATSDPVADVMSRYNLQDISPLEIDRLVEELRAVGHPMNETLMMLSSRGAEFMSHAQDLLGGAYNPNSASTSFPRQRRSCAWRAAWETRQRRQKVSWIF